MAAMTSTHEVIERPIMIFRPTRSARRPQNGDTMAFKAGVTPRLRPVHKAIWPTSVTPSWRMKSGRNGITSVKPVKPMKDAAVTANTFRRQPTPTRRLSARGTSSESYPDVLRRSHVDGVDEPDAMRVVLHDHRAR